MVTQLVVYTEYCTIGTARSIYPHKDLFQNLNLVPCSIVLWFTCVNCYTYLKWFFAIYYLLQTSK